MTLLGNGLFHAKQYKDALVVGEAELPLRRRLGDSEGNILSVQNNLAGIYQMVGRLEDALQMKRGVYSGWLRLNGEEDIKSLKAANNYALSLLFLQRFGEAKLLMRKMLPVARRVFGESHHLAIMMRWNYATALYRDDGATLDDLREAVTTIEETERAARRLLGGEHPTTKEIARDLRNARAALRVRESPN